MSQDIPTQPIGLRSLPRKQVTITLVGVMMAMFLSSLDQTVVSTAMPRIIADIGGFNQYTWVTTAYLITSAVTVPIVGKLTDIYGRKIFYVCGVAIFILGSILCGLSHTIVQLIFFRGFQGIGAGVMMANAFTVIGDLFPPAVRGKYQGLMSSVFGLSSIIGPTLGGFITDTLSWHWVFFVNIPLGLAVIILFVFFFPNFRPDNLKHSVDYPGVALLILFVVPMLLALSWGGVEYPWGSPEIIGMFIFAVIAFVFFLLIERRSREPIVPLSLFKNRIVAISQVMNFLASFGMFGSTIFIPLFFQGVLGATATTSGSFLTPMMLGTVFGSFLSGQFLSRTGGHYRIQGAIGMTILAVGFFLLSRMTVATSYGTAVRNIIITGFGMGITMPLYVIAVQNAVPYNFLGAATSATAFTRSIGGTVGLAIFGSVLSSRFAAELAVRIPPEVKTIIPQTQLDAMVHNPQALFSPEAQSQLQGIFGQLGQQGAALFQNLLQALRESLNAAIGHVFLYALAAVVVGFIVNLFLKEIPLRTHHTMETEPHHKLSQKPEI
jgi:EmrB/QacA subfamily drug resistance transporter